MFFYLNAGPVSPSLPSAILRLYPSEISEQCPVTYSSRYIVNFSAFFFRPSRSIYPCPLNALPLPLPLIDQAPVNKHKPGTGPRRLTSLLPLLAACSPFRREQHGQFLSLSTRPSVRDDTGGCWSRDGSTHLQVSGGVGPSHVREKVGVAAQLVNVDPVLLPIRQASSYKGLRRNAFINSSRDPLVVTRVKEEKWRWHTLASLLDTGLTGNCTSVAFSMVFSWRMSCCD